MRKFLIFGLMVLIFSCDKNHSPVIQSMGCVPISGKAGTVFFLTVVASDADGDALTFLWSADGGLFVDSINQRQAEWQSPMDGSGKTFLITVEVSDGVTMVKTVQQISLAGNGPPKVTDIRSYPETDAGGTDFAVKVIAVDPDKDPLTYQWTCSAGEVSDGRDRSLARWRSPISEKDTSYTLFVEISDGLHTIDTTLLIPVLRSPGGSFTGNTFYTGCRVPIAGVNITIAGLSTLTDSLGIFAITEVPMGTYIAEASKADFVKATREIVIPSGSTAESDFFLSSSFYTSKVYGVVLDQEGIPVNGAIIVMVNPDQTESILKATSDLLGNFEIQMVPKGFRTMMARKDATQTMRYENFSEEIRVSGDHTSIDIIMRKVSLVPLVVTQPAGFTSYNYSKSGGEVTYDGGSGIIKRGVCWSELRNPSIAGSKTSDGTGMGSFESGLTGLTAGKVYFIRAYATNSFGNTGYGEEITLSTLPNGTFTDVRDQKTYKTVDIGSQTWMAENLNFTAPSGSWCYEDKTSYCDELGRLYEWERVINVGSGKDICPAGWRVPTNAEWAEVRDFLGDNAGFKMKTSSGWSSNGNGDNSSGFSGKPGGYRESNGSYYGLTNGIAFWTASIVDGGNVWQYSLSNLNGTLYRYQSRTTGTTAYVRCLKQ